MRVNQIFTEDLPNSDQRLLQMIGVDCSDFLRESEGQPVFRSLPAEYDDLRKVKVRKHQNTTQFAQTFNEAFRNEIKDLRQRAIFTSSTQPEITAVREAFYVFPKNGYRFMYCTEVKHSSQDYQQVFDSLFEQFESEKAEQLIHDLLKFAYITEDLTAGIEKEAEIIFFNVPYYYAARTSAYDYKELLTHIDKVCDDLA